jgi:hypothetical protein
MNPGKNIKRISFLLVLVLVANILSCGYILYPERRGQTKGRIDPGVAILDAILFLPGILPGVVAFAVDFTTGCIYLSGEEADSGSDALIHTTSNADAGNLTFGPKETAELERILSKKTGKTVRLSPSDIQVIRINDPEYIRRHFTVAMPDKGRTSYAVR